MLVTLGGQVHIVVQVKFDLQSTTFGGTTHNLLIIAVALFVVVRDKRSIHANCCELCIRLVNDSRYSSRA